MKKCECGQKLEEISTNIYLATKGIVIVTPSFDWESREDFLEEILSGHLKNRGDLGRLR